MSDRKPTFPPDPLVDEIRQVRHEMSARFGHDPRRLTEYLMEFQKQFEDRLVTPPSTPDEDQHAA